MSQFVVGDVLAGKYEVKAILGAGGMGTVYRARQLDLGRDVAIKVPMPAALEIPGFLARFSREARLVAKLVHDNIVQVYEYQESQDSVYIVMEYVEGQDLKAMLGKPPADLKVKDLAIILRASCEGLAHAHEGGIVHRDIKPHNIMVAQTSRGRWRVKIMDFGIAHMDANTHATMLGGEQLTVTGQAIGTPSYMSPEQIRGTGVTSQSDIYSFGCVIHYCFTRQTPFAGTGFTVAASHLSDPPPSVRLAVPALPPELESIIFQCLEKDPAARPSDASDLGERIYKALEPLFEEHMVNLWPGAQHDGGGTEAIKATAAMEQTLGATMPTGTAAPTISDGGPIGPSSDRRPIPAPGVPASSPAPRRDVTQTSPTNTAPGNVADATIPYMPPSAAEIETAPVPAATGSKLPLLLAAVLVPLLLLGVGVGVVMSGKKKTPKNDPNGGTQVEPTPTPDNSVAVVAPEPSPVPTPVTGVEPTTTAATPKAPPSPTAVPTPTVNPVKARAERILADQAKIEAEYKQAPSPAIWNEACRLWESQSRDALADEPEVREALDKLAKWIGMSAPTIAINAPGVVSIGSDNDKRPEEGPIHNVRVSPFSLGVYEVTALEFATFLNDQPAAKAMELYAPGAGLNIELTDGRYAPVANRALHPANGISWNAAVAYTQWLADLTGRGFRLPTEAEWEVAARFDTRGRYPWGDAELSSDRANFSGSSGSTSNITDQQSGAHRLGFRHLAGNVAEWVADWYSESTYENDAKVAGGVQDPKGPAEPSGSRPERVLRGGGYKSLNQDDLRVTARGKERPTARDADFGFRLAVTP
ncbi:SUMF1/EgtB/PvdO family nonheme iron enzyme [bacterium]|nr:SUMF1/EgtB/PvdO family nonheme iron enzyme [bacterium]